MEGRSPEGGWSEGSGVKPSALLQYFNEFCFYNAPFYKKMQKRRLNGPQKSSSGI
jgi:hypothetical protein